MLPPASGPTLALQLPPRESPRQGYQVNVLGTSLVARLKQRQSDEPPRQLAKPPTGTKIKPIVKKSKVAPEYKLHGLEDEDTQSSDDGQTGGSERSRLAGGRQPRANSAVSGDSAILLPRLISSTRSNSGSRLGSRRSQSAGPDKADGDSRRVALCSSAGGLGPRAPSCPVHVVKRDGVFQPADKYMSGRLGIREAGESTLWVYHTYVLPVVDASNDNGSPRLSEPDTNLGLYLGTSKKRMKVSWKATSQSASNTQGRSEPSDGCHESRQDTIATPSVGSVAVPNKNKRVQSVDNLAFRRPKYSSGKSRVRSIGLEWSIPAVSAGDDTDSSTTSNFTSPNVTEGPPPTADVHMITEKPVNTTKPMWSYLVTQETKHIQPHSLSFQPSASPPEPEPKVIGKTKPARGKHCRNVHPVSTAMEQAGITVSKTRWTVPSSSASGLEAERAVRERLQLVKRSGMRLLYEPGGRGTSNSAAQRFRQALEEAGRVEEIEDHGEDNNEGDGCVDNRVGTVDSPYSGVRRRAGKGKSLTQGTSSTIVEDKALSYQDDDRISSPTKSRSTFYN